MLFRSNFVYAPEYFNAAHLPYELKHIITNKLSSSNNVQVVKSLLQQEGDNKHFKNFLHKTATLDRIRNEKFEEVFPEFYYYLKAYKLV
mgnify:CR=1 FL=1